MSPNVQMYTVCRYLFPAPSLPRPRPAKKKKKKNAISITCRLFARSVGTISFSFQEKGGFLFFVVDKIEVKFYNFRHDVTHKTLEEKGGGGGGGVLKMNLSALISHLERGGGKMRGVFL